ncbi:MAG TPA: 4a-hydroxytetrahydrobiopterin dehydratase [Candidatus Marinimicrobia bacterium]|jgi:4a-hydroxytetrahydrobiopterin dehydratase|nr:4a-hydroxytetrahydrobiopterin dehydratase [Candidatus Neomarinimicrobiota bacterium]HIM26610.1 4a-hydroxytetrahydrobiopterin dehydratase [Candidatus Neomarinimicrobiota bacterium]
MGLVCHDDFNRSSIYHCLLLAANSNEKSTQSGKEAAMSVLSIEQIQDELSNLDGWVFKNNAITKSYSFDSYMDGIGFVNRLAEKAEEVNHHPDMQVGWCRVSVAFTSHDKGGVTAICIAMAKATEKI